MWPVLLRFGRFQLASAPVFAGLAALTAFLYFRARRRALGLDDAEFWTLISYLAVGAIAGSLGIYAIFYGGGPAGNLPFWRNGRIEGGSFLGALTGSVAAVVLFGRVHRRPVAPVADVLGAAAPLGLVLMRIGCLLNGCCHGRPTGGLWGIEFTRDCAVPARLRGVPLYPTQLFESAGALAIFFIVVKIVRPRQEDGRLRPGDALFASLGLYGVLRFSVDFLRSGDPGLVAPLGLTLAQWVGATAAVVACLRFARVRR